MADLPWEILEGEIPRWLQFFNLLRLSRTCTRLQKNWKRWVTELPNELINRRSAVSVNWVAVHEVYVLDNDRLMEFTALTSLDLGRNDPITLECLPRLPKLTNFSFGHFYTAHPNLTLFPALKTLNIGMNYMFDDTHLSQLTTLTGLHISGNSAITKVGLAPLTSLTALHLGYNKRVVSADLTHLTSLTVLNIGYNMNIEQSDLRCLTSLEPIRMEYHNWDWI